MIEFILSFISGLIFYFVMRKVVFDICIPGFHDFSIKTHKRGMGIHGGSEFVSTKHTYLTCRKCGKVIHKQMEMH